MNRYLIAPHTAACLAEDPCEHDATPDTPELAALDAGYEALQQQGKHRRTAAPQRNEHPYGPAWVARQEAAARRNARIETTKPGGHLSPRCLTPAVDGECVCR